jgi:hypothetical protein
MSVMMPAVGSLVWASNWVWLVLGIEADAAAKCAVLGAILVVGLVFPAMAQLDLPCAAFEQDDNGVWYATRQVTVGTELGLLEVMPGHAVSLEVADVLNAVCQ